MKKEKETYTLLEDVPIEKIKETIKDYEKIIPSLDKLFTKIKDKLVALKGHSRALALEDSIVFLVNSMKVPPIVTIGILNKILFQLTEAVSKIKAPGLQPQELKLNYIG